MVPMTRYEAHLRKGWKENGLASVAIVRQRGDDSADLATFLVDIWCLGIKDAWLDPDLPPTIVNEALAEHIPDEERERIHPACAKKLIEGALAYAAQFGFAPHRDYRKARKILSGIDASLCPTEFEFGRHGQPFFLAGPNDSDERIDRVLAILEQHCGPDGYGFADLEAGEEDADDRDDTELRQALIEWLDTEAEKVPRFYQLSGLITAMQLCPRPLSPVQLLEFLSDARGGELQSREETEDFAALVFDYWNYVADLLAQVVQPDAAPEHQAMDVWMADFPEDTRQLGLMAACLEWATGFMRAIDRWPEAWADVLKRPDLAPHWEMLRWWADFIGNGNKDRIADAAGATPPRNLGQSALALARALRRPAPVTN